MARKSSDLTEIRRVLALEAATLLRVRDSVDASFARATALMASCRGKIVVTGIGKSGLIAQKIAATLASTGAPALYMHPAEGMHGDIGLIQRRDLVLAIGKSGESEELNAILPTLKRLKIKIVAVTAERASTLGRAADEALVTPIDREACPLNLAPTCSTTAALAVGDALAIALMKRRGFQRHHFALLHPGGQLGKRLTLTVKDVMRSGERNPVVRATDSSSRMLSEMTRQQAGAVSVIDAKGRLKGLITDFDLRRVLAGGGDLRLMTLPEIMNRKPTSVRPEMLAAEAAALMADRPRPLSLLPVADARGRAVGLLHMHDIRARGL